MKKFFKTLSLFLCFFTLFSIPYNVKATNNTSSDNIPFNTSTANLKMNQRQLWIEHVLWTRNFIISDVASLEDKDVILQRLLKNQDDIGDSIKPYYGEEAAKKLSELLKEHISIAGQVVDSAKNNNKDDLEKYNKLWYENADKIADFLSNANPTLSNKVLKSMLYKHLELTTNEAVARLKKDWNSDVSAYDAGEKHMIMFADVLSDGIIKQFSKNFK